MASIASLHHLLSLGQVQDQAGLLSACLSGLAHPIDNGWVISQRLLAARQLVSNDAELIAAILATQDTYRTAWSRIAAARCQEAGQLQDSRILPQLITRLGEAAHWVEQALPHASLAPSTHTTEERELFGCSAEQNTATPMLIRVLACAWRLRQWQTQALPTLEKVDTSGQAIRENWCAGRLLVLPGHTLPTSKHSAGYLLQAQPAQETVSGSCVCMAVVPTLGLVADHDHLRPIHLGGGKPGRPAAGTTRRSNRLATRSHSNAGAKR